MKSHPSLTIQAIITPGESAILAIGAINDEPVVTDGKDITIRKMMPMTVTCDHRLIDGAMAARFLKLMKDKLEDMGLWESLI